MFDTPRCFPLASAAVLALVMSQGAALAADQPDQPAPAAVPAAAPAPDAAAAPGPRDTTRAQAEQRRAELDAQRNQRYEELRARAAELGVELPAAPPWANAGVNAGAWPAMPPRAGMSPEAMEQLRAQREAMREKMRNMTPEERQAQREAHWQDMRARAAERGVEMPETPPWAEAESRYQAAQEQFERYRKIIDEMTPEQIEAARAVFGRGGPGMRPMGPRGPRPPMMPPQQGGYGQQGGYPGFSGYQNGPGPMMGPPAMPDEEGEMEQAPPPPPGQ